MPLPPPIFEWNYTSARLYEAEVLPAPPHDRYAATFETAQSLRPLSALPDAGLILRASNFLLRIFFLLCVSLAFLASASLPLNDSSFFTVAYNGSISNESSWTEAVLFDEKGFQLTYSEVEEEFEGPWELEYNGVHYCVDVRPDTADSK